MGLMVMMMMSLYIVGLCYIMWRSLPGILVSGNTCLLDTISSAALRFSRQDLPVDFSPTRALFLRKCVCLQSLETINDPSLQESVFFGEMSI